MRRPLIAGNWKMNGSLTMAAELAGALVVKMKGAGTPAFDMLICPPFPYLAAAAAMIEGSGIQLGAQTCHAAESGAHTGEVAAKMLADVGCTHVLLGHSERRADNGETDAMVRARAEAAHAAGLVAVVCVGETEKERDAGQTIAVVTGQLKGSLPDGITAADTVVAYEPVWAIGTGRTPTEAEVQEVHAAIRAELASRFGKAVADGVRILYGGSMKPSNAKGLMALPDVDGGLIGGASLKAEDFWACAEAAG